MTRNPVISYVADDYFAMSLSASVSSVIANLAGDRQLSIFVVDVGIPRSEKGKIEQLADSTRISIEWLHPAESHRDLIKSLPGGYVGRNCYYKMLIPELLGPEHSRTIYLDSDVIVEADIGELWDINMGENYVLAARDLINPFVSSPFGLANWRELGRRPDEFLFNSGVLVLNNAKWREEKIFSRLAGYLRDNRQSVRLCDQDAMNAIFRRDWGRLDPLWNVLPYMKVARGYSLLDRESHEALIMNARILHFCGPGKPWKWTCSHPRKERFFYYLDKTPWEGWRPKWWVIDASTFSYYRRRVEAGLRRIIGKVKRILAIPKKRQGDQRVF